MMKDRPIVLKLKCDGRELEEEVIAIKAYNGLECITLIDYNLSFKAMILEQAIPGKSLSSLFPDNDKQATQIAANCIRSLHTATIPPNIQFKTVDQIIPHFKHRMALLAPFMNYAKELRESLLKAPFQEVLLHGDFHPGNIVSTANNKWIVIDPEGIIGDPLYDLAIYIRNPLIELMKSKDPLKVVTDRINDFAKALNHPAQQIYEWCYLQAVTSTYWSLEDRLDVTQHIAFLNLLNGIKKQHK